MSQLRGQWYIVINTYGCREFTAYDRQQLNKTPGQQIVRPTASSERESWRRCQRVGCVPLDLDANLHMGTNGFTLKDPDRERDACGPGIRSAGMHDGSCGHLQQAQVSHARSLDTLLDAFSDLFGNQLRFATRNARFRALRLRRPLSPELHVGVSCEGGRHRAEMVGAFWLKNYFKTLSDVGEVEVRAAYASRAAR